MDRSLMEEKLSEACEMGSVDAKDVDVVRRYIDVCMADRRFRQVVLKESSDGLKLIFRQAKGSAEPYVIAHGYDEETGGWDFGRYYSDAASAFDRIDPCVLEEATVKWTRMDIEAAFDRIAAKFDDEDVEKAIGRALLHRGWKSLAIEHGIECIEETVRDIVQERKAFGS